MTGDSDNQDLRAKLNSLRKVLQDHDVGHFQEAHEIHVNVYQPAEKRPAKELVKLS